MKPPCRGGVQSAKSLLELETQLPHGGAGGPGLLWASVSSAVGGDDGVRPTRLRGGIRCAPACEPGGLRWCLTMNVSLGSQEIGERFPLHVY